MKRTLLVLAAAGALLATLVSPAAAAVSTELVPFRMDASNQAGWWKPIDEHNGTIYAAYDAWGSPTEMAVSCPVAGVAHPGRRTWLV